MNVIQLGENILVSSVWQNIGKEYFRILDRPTDHTDKKVVDNCYEPGVEGYGIIVTWQQLDVLRVYWISSRYIVLKGRLHIVVIDSPKTGSGECFPSGERQGSGPCHPTWDLFTRLVSLYMNPQCCLRFVLRFGLTDNRQLWALTWRGIP